MWRVLIYIALIAAAAYGAVWLANQPGGVSLVWQGQAYSTTLVYAAIAAVALAGLLILAWIIARTIMRLPNTITRGSARRRRQRGLRAISRGMIAVGAGDVSAARRHSQEAERALRPDEPLVLLLRAQAAQIAGDVGQAETAFRSMLDNPETRVLGLRGLYVEARRSGDTETAWTYAREAARLAPAVSWANEAVLESQCARGDWRAALETVERRAATGLLDRDKARRHRAVLLAADALSRSERDEEEALRASREAAKLAPDLVPAAVLAGEILGRRGELRKASRVLETSWSRVPHPDIASAYLYLRTGDAPRDRMKRAQTLAKLSRWDPESRLALARAALEARDFSTARHTLTPLLDDRPTVRACLLMAEIEKAEHGSTGKAREWLARAVHAPRDKAWVADGIVAERWAPVSPVTGRLDAFVWTSPPEVPAGTPVLDAVLGDLDERPTEPVAILPPSSETALRVPEGHTPAERAEKREAAATPPEAKPASVGTVADAPHPAPEPAAKPLNSAQGAALAAAASTATAETTQPAVRPAEAPRAPASDEALTRPKLVDRPADASEPASEKHGNASKVELTKSGVPVPPVPDDPGSEPQPEPKRARFRLLG